MADEDVDDVFPSVHSSRVDAVAEVLLRGHKPLLPEELVHDLVHVANARCFPEVLIAWHAVHA